MIIENKPLCRLDEVFFLTANHSSGLQVCCLVALLFKIKSGHKFFVFFFISSQEMRTRRICLLQWILREEILAL